MEDHHRASLVVDDNMDFHNPTASMIADAKSMGVDLMDLPTIELLEKLKDGGVDREWWVQKSENSRDGRSNNTGASSMRFWHFLYKIVLPVGIAVFFLHIVLLLRIKDTR